MMRDPAIFGRDTKLGYSAVRQNIGNAMRRGISNAWRGLVCHPDHDEQQCKDDPNSAFHDAYGPVCIVDCRTPNMPLQRTV